MMRFLVAALLVLATDADTGSIRDIILERDGLSNFRLSLTAAGLFNTLMDNRNANLTVFAPTNRGIEESAIWMKYLNDREYWKGNLLRTVNNHIIVDKVYSTPDAVYKADPLGLQSLEDMLRARTSTQGGTIENQQILETVNATNGVLHIVNGIFAPQFFDMSLARLEVMPEFGPDEEDRIALVDVIDHLQARYEYDRDLPMGMTNVGCRIRAFNRMPDYLLQTINRAHDVKYGEFLNDSFVNETIYNFVQYSLIEKVYYDTDYEHGYEELIMSQNWCAHMWVTKHEERLCFNNACMVIAPPAFSNPGTPEEKRIQIANNGVGYVVDKCVVCPGVAMLTEYASEFTRNNMKDIAQYFTASEWNRRNLSMSVGDGGPITLFAPVNTGWGKVTGFDTTRLSTDMWKPHMWDMLRHMLVQGNYTEKELRQMVIDNKGPYNITTLAGQHILLDIDKERDKLLVNDGEVFYSDIHGVDGQVQFVTEVPLVRSMTHSVYEIADFLGHFFEQLNLIDSVFLDDDMKRLEPLTALFVPNKDWRNKILPLDRVEHTLENHMFKSLIWCSTLREMAQKGDKVESLNGNLWSISLTSDGMPCFDTVGEFGTPKQLSCITECDILARNGLVHIVNKVVIMEAVETRGPTPSLPPVERPPTRQYPDGAIVSDQPYGQGGSGANTDVKGNISFKRPKRLYEADEVDESGDQRREIGVLAALLPLVWML